MANCYTITQTLQAEGFPVELVNASRDGYFYFVYDADGVYETNSVYVCRFHHLSKEQWLDEGREFARKISEQIAEAAALVGGKA